ncbi:MAG: ectonucleotide pyrophosphatase/phosphodiesterase [Gemmatimonadaceae bacterium]
MLVSIDGLRPDYVFNSDRYGLKIPTLRRFVREGSAASGVVGVVPTVTYPSHATLVTGVSPARHGIYANTTFDPLGKNFGGWYWYAEDIRVPTIWDAAGEAGLTTANVHWPVTVGARITYNLPQLWRTGTSDDRKLLRALSTRDLLDTLERTLGPYANGIDESITGDETRARFAARLIALKHPAFATVYLTALDHEQHATGPFSPTSLSVLERIDSALAGIVEAASAVGAARTIVAVVSDHGFDRTDRAVNLLSAFRRAGLVTFASDSASRPTTWRATVWPAGGSAAVVIADSTDGETRDRVRGLLARLAADRQSGIDRVVDNTELRRRGGFPGAAFLVNLKAGYALGGATRGPLVTTLKVGGMHGYLPDIPSMRSSLFLLGAGIPSGQSLGLVDMRDVAPTLATLLGLQLPQAEGRDLFRPDTGGMRARRGGR